MKKRMILVASLVSVLLVAAVSGVFSSLDFCQIEVKAETKSGYSYDDPVILFGAPCEYQVSFYLDTHWGCYDLQEGIPIGDWVYLFLNMALLEKESYPMTFANATTVVIYDDMGNVVWTQDHDHCGINWNEEMEEEWGPVDFLSGDDPAPIVGGAGFMWRPEAVGNYTVSVMFEGLIYDDVPSEYRDVVSIRVYPPGPFVGTVTSGDDSAAISNASVEAFINGEVKATTTTDSEGAFNLQLKETGVYDVKASAPGYTPVVQRGVNTELEPKHLDFALAPLSLAPDFNILWRVTSKNSRNVAVDSQGNVIVASEGENSQTVVSKFGPKGNLLWKISESFSGSSEVPRGIAVDSANNILMLVEPRNILWVCNTYTVKLDPDGNEMWKKVFTTNENEGTSIAVDSLDNVIAIGVEGGQTTLVKYASDGGRVWSKTLPIYFFTGEIVTDNGNNIILGGTTISDVTSDDYYIAKLDADGNLLWEKTFDCKERKCDNGCGISMDDQWDYGYAVALDSSENIIVTGNKITVKLGPDGNEMWRKYFPGDDLVVDLNNNIFTVHDSLVEMYDANGVLLGNIDLTEELYSIAICQDNTLIAAGEHNVIKIVDGNATTQLDDSTTQPDPANSDLNTPPENASDTTGSEPTQMSNPEPSQEPSTTETQTNEAPPVSAVAVIISIVAVTTVSTIYKKHKH